MNGIRTSRSVIWVAALVLQAAAVLGLGLEAQAGEWKVGRLVQDTTLYSKPDGSSPAIVRYPRGSQLRAYMPDRGGWVAIYLSRPVRGVQYAWVPARALQFAQSASGAQLSDTVSSSGSSLRKSWFALGASMTMAAPSDFQAGIGEPLTPISLMGIEAEYGHFLSPKFYGVIRGGNFSFTQAETLVSGQSYSATGLYGTLGFGYMFARKPSFGLGLEASGGVSMCTVGDFALVSGATTAISSSGIMAFPIRIALRSQIGISGGFGLNLILGYEMHTLSQVTTFNIPTATQQNYNMSLGGMLFGGRLSYAF